jgi:hypothetical protein
MQSPFQDIVTGKLNHIIRQKSTDINNFPQD